MPNNLCAISQLAKLVKVQNIKYVKKDFNIIMISENHFLGYGLFQSYSR